MSKKLLNGRTVPDGYEEKFSAFIRMSSEAKSRGLDLVLIASPHVIGDTYEEVIESLSRLADAELMLRIVPTTDR